MDGRAALVVTGAIFWITGMAAFFLSSVLDNLTTALVMGAVVVSVGTGQSAIPGAGLHQYCRGGQRGRCVLSIRGHHDADGLAGTES